MSVTTTASSGSASAQGVKHLALEGRSALSPE